MIFAAECAEIVDIPGICGYNVSVILDKYAPLSCHKGVCVTAALAAENKEE